MKNSETKLMKRAGMGFTGWLAILFIALKLIGVIQWSWLWVLAPLWIPVAVVLGIWVAVFLTMAIIAGIMGIITFFLK